MILPTKHLSKERSIIGVGGEVLLILNKPMTISSLWNNIKESRKRIYGNSFLSFDWFILSLDFLFMLNLIEFKSGKIDKVKK